MERPYSRCPIVGLSLAYFSSRMQFANVRDALRAPTGRKIDFEGCSGERLLWVEN